MPDWTDDNIVFVSAIEHYSYCPRQCALIHVEKVFDENIFTLRGSIAHERADVPAGMTEHAVRVEKALPIWSESYGLYGRADVVEFHPDGAVFPVEYKIGSRKRRIHDELQLCAQAICLEEMLGCPVMRGAVYSSSSRQRREVELTQELREKTFATIEAIRLMLREAKLPPPVDDARCPDCSLVHVCLPTEVTGLVRWSGERLFIPGEYEVAE